MDVRSSLPGREMVSQCLGPFLALLQARGVPLELLLREAGLQPKDVGAAEVRLPLPRFVALMDAGAEHLGDPLAGVHLAEIIQPGTYGLVEFASATSSTLREVVGRLVRLSGLINAVARYSLEDTAEGVRICHQVPGEALGLGRQGNEYTLAILLLMARALSTSALVPRRLWFAHSAPSDTGALAKFFGTDRLDFNAGTNGFIMDPALMDVPLEKAHSALNEYLVAQAEASLKQRQGPGSFLVEVEAAISRDLANGPTLERVAPVLRLSARTLQRRLTELGTSFQDLLDETRVTRARRMLDDSSLELADIAEQLGYSEPRAFIRAFKRWTGGTPGAHRQRA